MTGHDRPSLKVVETCWRRFAHEPHAWYQRVGARPMRDLWCDGKSPS